MKRIKSTVIKIIVFCLVFSAALPVNVNAASIDPIMPCASYYLDAYSAYVYVTSTGEVQVWFDVMGTGDMDEIGALSIMLYESTNDGKDWTLEKTFLHDKTSGMLFKNDYYVSSHVTWPYGSTQRQYKAYVCVWAGKNGDGDARYFWAY